MDATRTKNGAGNTVGQKYHSLAIVINHGAGLLRDTIATFNILNASMTVIVMVAGNVRDGVHKLLSFSINLTEIF